MTDTNNYRVAIVGAGPVGCVAALALAEAGVKVLLIEANEVLPEDLRASTFHPPTLDMLSELGLTEFLIENGLIAKTYQYRDRETGIYAEFDLSVLEGIVKHPFRVQCEQFKLTRKVVELLGEHPNAQVHLGAAFTRYEENGDSVTVHFTKDGQDQVATCEYLLGTDGSRSLVREQMGMEFEGFTYPEQFLVVATDVPMDEKLPNLAPVNYVSAADDWCVVLRVVGNWRILFPTDAGADREALLDPDTIEARLQRLAPHATRYPVLHKSLYRIHQRVAKTYRQGRVLIAGDAAHLNNPLGGMGMNGGVHDVVNLVSKLVPVLEGKADADVLDVYDRQRRTVTWNHVQAQTIANKKIIEELNEEERIGRIHNLQKTAADRDSAIAYLRRHNMLDALEEAAQIA
jgi:3-(3-hydroxy-phenyl)propionate hydroxylase